MHEYRMDPDELDDFLKVVDPRAARPGAGHRRRVQAAPGAAALSAPSCCSELLRAGKPALGLDLGARPARGPALFEAFGRASRRPTRCIAAASELNLLRSRSPAHGEELIPWTAQAMAALGLEETDEEKRLRAAACLLADIGWRAHPDYRGEQSLNIITNAAFVGIDHPGRAYLALAIYYRHAGLSEEELGAGLRELAPLRYRESARALAGAFRVAYLVSGAVAGVLPRTKLRRAGDRHRAGAAGRTSPIFAAARLDSRMRQFAALGGLSFADRRREDSYSAAISARLAVEADRDRRRGATSKAPARRASAPAPARRKACAASPGAPARRRGRRRRSAPGRRCSR